MLKENSKMKDKAILISTGEEFEIDKYWVTIDVKVPTNSKESEDFIKKLMDSYKEEIKIEDDFKLQIPANNYNPIVESNRNYYLLSNGMKVKDNEVIVGIENIRDYKINQINGI